MKTMKNFLSMAALAMMGAMMTGCSSDDNAIVNNPRLKIDVLVKRYFIQLILAESRNSE